MRAKLVAMFLGLPLAASCSSRPSPVEDLPPLGDLVPDPARMPRPPDQPPEMVSVSQILCSYRGAQDALRKIQLTRQESKTRCEHLLRLARAQGQDFAALAKRFSDDASTSQDGGDLGVIGRGELHPDLEKAAFGLQMGQVSEVVESPRGFSILNRHPPTEFQCAEIVVTWTGAKRYTPRIPRDRQQARELAEQIHSRILSGSPFGEEALQHSDHPSYPAGGVYPVFKKGTLHPKLEEIVFGLEEDRVSSIIETETGFHIVSRLPPRTIQVRLIAVEFSLPGDEPDKQRRSREEALALIQTVRRQAVEARRDFAELAAEHSDGPEKTRGGLSEPFGRGRRPYVFEKTAFSLKVGEVSEVVEAPRSFLIAKRIR